MQTKPSILGITNDQLTEMVKDARSNGTFSEEFTIRVPDNIFWEYVGGIYSSATDNNFDYDRAIDKLFGRFNQTRFMADVLGIGNTFYDKIEAIKTKENKMDLSVKRGQWVKDEEFMIYCAWIVFEGEDFYNNYLINNKKALALAPSNIVTKNKEDFRGFNPIKTLNRDKLGGQVYLGCVSQRLESDGKNERELEEIVLKKYPYFYENNPEQRMFQGFGRLLHDEKKTTQALGIKDEVAIKFKEVIKGRFEPFKSNSNIDRQDTIIGLFGFTIARNINTHLLKLKKPFENTKNLICYTKDINRSVYHDIVLIPFENEVFDAIRKIGTSAGNYSLETEDIIDKLKEWDDKYGIEILGLEDDYVDVLFLKKSRISYKELAQEIYEFCPDSVEQGTLTIEALEKELRKNRSIFLWWD